MFVEQEAEKSNIPGMVRIKRESHLEGLESQGFVMEPESHSQTAVKPAMEEGFILGGNESQISETEKRQVETVEILFLEVNGFHIKTKALIPCHLPAVETPDQVGFVKCEYLIFKPVEALLVPYIDKLPEAGATCGVQSGDQPGTHLHLALSDPAMVQVTADSSGQIEIPGAFPQQVAVGEVKV